MLWQSKDDSEKNSSEQWVHQEGKVINLPLNTILKKTG